MPYVPGFLIGLYIGRWYGLVNAFERTYYKQMDGLDVTPNDTFMQNVIYIATTLTTAVACSYAGAQVLGYVQEFLQNAN